MSNRRKVSKFSFKDETYTIKKHGLVGKEKEILDGMFTENKKHTVRFEKLNSLQKKVLRKMGFDRSTFLLSSNQ